MSAATLAAPNPDFAIRVRESFARQNFMGHIGAKLLEVVPGGCTIGLDYAPYLTQQHGFFHGGVIGTLADNAGGYAAFTLAPADASILTVEYKLNLVSPGGGDRLLATGQVLRPGRTLVVCESRVFAEKDGNQKLCAVALVTLMLMAGRSDTQEPT